MRRNHPIKLIKKSCSLPSIFNKENDEEFNKLLQKSLNDYENNDENVVNNYENNFNKIKIFNNFKLNKSYLLLTFF